MNPADEKTQKFRNAVLEVIKVKYNDLISFVNTLNLHPMLRSHANMNLDQGLYWLVQGINIIDLKPEEEKEEVKEENVVKLKESVKK